MLNELEVSRFVGESDWLEICERARFFCRICGERPMLDDIAAFLDRGLCSCCAAALERWGRY